MPQGPGEGALPEVGIPALVGGQVGGVVADDGHLQEGTLLNRQFRV